MNAHDLIGKWKWAKKEDDDMDDFFEDTEVLLKNAAIKDSLNLLIQEMTQQRDGTFKATKLAIEQKVQKRVEEEVEELLADEQRSTEMGQWA